MVVPADVRTIIGRGILIETTGETDEHRAASVAAPIIARFRDEIRSARLTAKPLGPLTAEILAERYRAERATTSDPVTITEITDVVAFTLDQIGQSYRAYGRQVREAGYDAYAGLCLLPQGEKAAAILGAATGHATRFDAYLEEWKPHAGVKPRSLDQAISTIQQFTRDIGKSPRSLRGSDVHDWVEKLINSAGAQGLSIKTINRKLSELRNYWGWMQGKGIVPEDVKPFTDRRIREPFERHKTKAQARQRWRPEEVVQLWRAATKRRDLPLAHMIKIAAYSGARIEGVARLRVSDIKTDLDTGIRYMCMTDKSMAGDRHVPVHPQINVLIDDLVRTADQDGYLIQSSAKNRYGERSQPLGKRFGRLKADLGYDERYVFHSIQKRSQASFKTPAVQRVLPPTSSATSRAL